MSRSPRLRRRRFLAIVIALCASLAGCAPSGPDDTAQATASAEATPELVEVGAASVLESEWSYAVGAQDDGVCTRLEVAGTASTRCGDLLPPEDAALGEVGRGPAEYEEAHVVEGFVTDEALTVWLVGDGGQYRIPAVMMPLDDVGIEGAQAYVGFARADVTLTHLQAVALNGDVLQTHELP